MGSADRTDGLMEAEVRFKSEDRLVSVASSAVCKEGVASLVVPSSGLVASTELFGLLAEASGCKSVPRLRFGCPEELRELEATVSSLSRVGVLFKVVCSEVETTVTGSPAIG